MLKEKHEFLSYVAGVVRGERIVAMEHGRANQMADVERPRTAASPSHTFLPRHL